MKKTGIFYGSTTGTTAEVAGEIAKALNVPETSVYDVAKTAPDTVGEYDVIILGSSTWGDGDMQDDMSDFIHGIEAMDLRGKEIAVFGCGDETMSDTFCNAVGLIYDRVKKTGAKMIGGFGTIGYHYDHSAAIPADAAEAEGLLIDNVNHPELTSERIARWAAQLVKEETAV